MWSRLRWSSTLNHLDHPKKIGTLVPQILNFDPVKLHGDIGIHTGMFSHSSVLLMHRKANLLVPIILMMKNVGQMIFEPENFWKS